MTEAELQMRGEKKGENGGRKGGDKSKQQRNNNYPTQCCHGTS